MAKAKAAEKGRSDQSEARPKANGAATGVGPAEKENASPTSEQAAPAGQNIALKSGGSGVSSLSSSSSTTGKQEKNRMNATLKFRKTDKSGSSSYAIEGLKSSVYFNKGMFSGEPPATLEVTLPEGAKFGEPGQAKSGIAAMTKEQREAALADRKAKLAAMSPAERAALKIEQARKTLEAAEKAAAKLALTPA